jgi:hypothetical protein
VRAGPSAGGEKPELQIPEPLQAAAKLFVVRRHFGFPFSLSAALHETVSSDSSHSVLAANGEARRAVSLFPFPLDHDFPSPSITMPNRSPGDHVLEG